MYKTQGQNAQRLLAMNETLREKEELSRIDADHLRKAREDVTNLKRKVEQHTELMEEKDRAAQVAFVSLPCKIVTSDAERNSFCTMRSQRYNSSSTKSRSAIRTWLRTTRRCYSGGWTPSRSKRTR